MFENFYLNIKLEEDGIMPTRAHDTDAGCDVYSPHHYVIQSFGDVLIPLNWRCEFPNGYAMILQEKSGIATKYKLDLGAKLVDSAYRGIVHCHLFNNSDKAIEICSRQKIAQFIITPVWTGQPTKVKELNLNTDRGEGGFGSTGI